jgi:hypothetical protein
VGIVLVGLGVFGIVLAILLPTVVVSKSKKTPLDLDISQVSSGPAKLFDATTNKVRQVTLRATRHVRTDSHASDSTNTTVVESLCIMVDDGSLPKSGCSHSTDPRLLSISTDRVTADRKSAEAVHVAKYQENINGNTNARHTGLAYKWPIDAQKKTYQFFQPDVGKAFPATYQGTSTIRGLTVYEFRCATGNQSFKINGTFPGTYNDTRTVWIEPRTGAIIKGTEQQKQTLANGTVALDTDLSFEKSAIDYQSNYAKDKIDQLRLAQVWGPLIAGLLGIAALVVGVLLLRRRDDAGGSHRQDAARSTGGREYGAPDVGSPEIFGGDPQHGPPVGGATTSTGYPGNSQT